MCFERRKTTCYNNNTTKQRSLWSEKVKKVDERNTNSQQSQSSMQTRSNQRKVNDRSTGPGLAPSTPAPPSTPARARDETPGDDSSYLSTASPGGTNPLPVHIQKLLCEDIEAHGGIGALVGTEERSLHHLLNYLCETDGLRKSLYKEPGDPIRRQIQNKACLWKRHWNSGIYEKKVLSKLGVVAAANRPTTLEIPRTGDRPTRKRVAVEVLQASDDIQDDDFVVNDSFPVASSSSIEEDRAAERVQESPRRAAETPRVHESPQIPRSLIFKKPVREADEDFVQSFAKMSMNINSQLYFETGNDASHPEVDNRTCECSSSSLGYLFSMYPDNLLAFVSC